VAEVAEQLRLLLPVVLPNGVVVAVVVELVPTQIVQAVVHTQAAVVVAVVLVLVLVQQVALQPLVAVVDQAERVERLVHLVPHRVVVAAEQKVLEHQAQAQSAG
jgi:hypothetical protein